MSKFAKLASFGLVFALATSACSNGSAPLTPENFDIESPEAIKAAATEIEREFADAVQPQELDEKKLEMILDKYSHVDPKKYVPADLLKSALAYFDANKSKFENQRYITIVDFKPRSDRYRFFLIDLSDGEVDRYHTTHGSGSDRNADGVAEVFGNVPDTGMSSIGFMRTGPMYEGNFGRSLRLDGLSSSNSKIRERAIVYHGWDYVKEANVVQGLTKGCFTIDWKFKDGILDRIKGKSLMYAGVSKI